MQVATALLQRAAETGDEDAESDLAGGYTHNEGHVTAYYFNQSCEYEFCNVYSYMMQVQDNPNRIEQCLLPRSYERADAHSSEAQALCNLDPRAQRQRLQKCGIDRHPERSLRSAGGPRQQRMGRAAGSRPPGQVLVVTTGPTTQAPFLRLQLIWRVLEP